MLQIAGRILAEHEVPVSLRCRRSYAPRAHRIQRGERDRAFVERILAEEGMFYWFSQDVTGELLVIADETTAYAPMVGPGRLRHLASDAAVGIADEWSIVGLRETAVLRPRHRVRRFRQHDRPRQQQGDATQLPLEHVELQASSPRAGLLYDHDHDAESLPVQLRSAADRLDATRQDAKLARARTSSQQVCTAATFHVEEHAEARLNQEYVVVRAEHTGDVSSEPGGRDYQTTVMLAPRGIAPRPKRPKRKRAPGLETVTVIGPPGEEIHTDELGRVQVRFHWDIETRGFPPVTAWLRVAQAWAGSSHGLHFTPRVGSELLVGYVDADPDRPVVLGSLHNAESPTPWPLPTNKTKSGIVTRSSPLTTSGGTNHLVFEDRAGEESVSLHAARSLSIAAEQSATMTVGDRWDLRVAGKSDETFAKDARSTTLGSRTERIGGASTLQVEGVSRRMVQGDEHCHLASDSFTIVDGELRLRVGVGRHTDIGGTAEAEANDMTSVSGRYHLGVRRNLALESQQGISLRCGDSRVDILPNRIVLESKELVLQSSGSVTLLTEKNGVKSSLALDDATTLSGSSVGVSSTQGSSLSLGPQAKLEAPRIQFACPASAKQPQAEDPDAPTTDAIFEVRPEQLPPGIGEVVVVVASPTGELLERPCPVGGTVSFPGRPGHRFTLRGIKIGGRLVPYQDVTSKKQGTES